MTRTLAPNGLSSTAAVSWIFAGGSGAASSVSWFQLTGLFQVFAGLGLGEGGHLVELEMDAGVFEAIEVDALAVNHTVRQLFGQTLL